MRWFGADVGMGDSSAGLGFIQRLATAGAHSSLTSLTATSAGFDSVDLRSSLSSANIVTVQLLPAPVLLASRSLVTRCASHVPTALDNAYGASVFSFTPTRMFSTVIDFKNRINTGALAQLFLFTAPDTTALFYYASLLTYEDWGLSFAPAVKELMQKTFSYSTFQYLSSSKVFLARGAAGADCSVSSNAQDFAALFFFEQAARTYISALALPYQAQITQKPLAVTTDSSVLTLRSS